MSYLLSADKKLRGRTRKGDFKMKKTQGLSFVVLALFLVFTIIIVGFGCGSESAESRIGTVDQIEITLTLMPESHSIDASATITWTPARIDTFFFLLHNGLEIYGVGVFGGVATGRLDYGVGESAAAQVSRLTGQETEEPREFGHLRLYGLGVEAEKGRPIELSFAYRGEIYDSVSVPEFSRWQIADETTGLIDPKGAFLTPGTGYYPLHPGTGSLATFKSTIEYPEGWEAVVEGNIVTSKPGRTTFDSVQPLDGSYLVAGPYKLSRLDADGIEIAMYHYPQSASLTGRYLGASASYIKKYNELIGPYAFERFSVVENWFPTGYGMPTYTLLGSQVIRLPFIVGTSLGHEVCHNWWGNGVLVDYESGNWCEGLTVYCADYLYKLEESEEAAKQYRMDALRAYSEYIVRGDDEDMPLRDFRERTTAGTRTIGYGKSMMVFHMVEQRIGSEAFWEALREIYREKQFERTSWKDFFETFERLSGVELGWFLKQWIDRPGAPGFAIGPVQFEGDEDGGLIEFYLEQVQEGNPYKMDIPIRITYTDGSQEDGLLHDVSGKIYHARVLVRAEPTKMEIDPDFRLFRILDQMEAPPTLAGFFATVNPLIILPATTDPLFETYSSLAEAFTRKGGEIIKGEEIGDERLIGRTVLHLGNFEQMKVTRDGATFTLAGATLDGANIAVVNAWRDSEDPSITHLGIWGESPEAIMPLGSKLPHYGKYSYLAFSSGRNIVKGQWPVEDSPLKVRIGG